VKIELSCLPHWSTKRPIYPAVIIDSEINKGLRRSCLPPEAHCRIAAKLKRQPH
jgi:hypothetical protein